MVYVSWTYLQLSPVPISKYKCLTHMGEIKESLGSCEIWHYCVFIQPYKSSARRQYKHRLR